MLIITSPDNNHVKEVKSLASKKQRDEKCLFVVEGIRAVTDAVSAGAELTKIFMSESYSIDKTDTYDCEVFIVTDRLFSQLADTESPQGILAVVRQLEHLLDEAIDKTDFIVILENVQDPGNVGTIIRTADAAGVGLVLLADGCADIYNPKVVRSTMASLFHVPVNRIKGVTTCVELLKQKGFVILATNLEAGISSFDVCMTGKHALMFGNEGNGLSQEAISSADLSVYIPMKGKAESLNVSIAAGVLMFEKLRQDSGGH